MQKEALEKRFLQNWRPGPRASESLHCCRELIGGSPEFRSLNKCHCHADDDTMSYDAVTVASKEV